MRTVSLRVVGDGLSYLGNAWLFWFSEVGGRVLSDEQLDFALAAVTGVPFLVTIIAETFVSFECHFFGSALYKWLSGFLRLIGRVMGR